MKRILLIGNGAREHAIAEALKRSPQGCELAVYASARNPGLQSLASVYTLGSLADLESMARFAETFKPDFAVIGPDNPIADGAADALALVGIPSVAPMKTLARLESSKSFTRDLLKQYNIPGCPQFRVFYSEDGIREFMEELGGNFVVKADGLRAGKGVKVSGDHLASIDEGVAYSVECLMADEKVVIEEKLIGEEFSLMSFADGYTVVDMPAIQDHKRAFDGDTGPNTGGMGTYSDANHSLPFLRPSDLTEAHDITVQVMKALHAETGHHYKGIMYGGFIATKDGVKLIEYNARFGDPEAMNALSLLKSDFIEVCLGIINGRLSEVPVEFAHRATVVKYVVPQGYPDNSVKGEKIVIGDVPANVKLYYGSVDQQADGLYLGGSRALAFVGMGETIAEAEQAAQAAIEHVKGPVFFRRDIGTSPLIQKRIDHMRELRGN